MTPPSPPSRPAAEALRWGGLLVLLACATLRATVDLEPLPHWDLDPARVSAPVTGIGPAGTMLLDAVTLLAAAAALLGERLRGRAVRAGVAALFAVGAAGVLVHALRGPGVALEHLRLGTPWIAAFATGVALAHLARDARHARLAAAVLTGFIAVLAAKGALEVFVEHPMTLANFRANREAYIAAQGWTPGSPAALAFERRLSQPEATGWFALANVYASFAAAAAVALVGLTFLAWRLTRRPAQLLPDGIAGVVTLGLAGALAAAWMAGSKAGVAVVAFGAAVLLVPAGLSLWRRRSAARPPASGDRDPAARSDALARRLAPLLAAATIGLPLLAVALRGLVGERLGELSILFRWFYLQGAARIIAADPLVGVGPAGFKDAYALAKPPLSPEDVTSPHSILFDLAAALGLFGLAWIALVVLWTHAAARTLLAPAHDPTERAAAAPDDGGPDRPFSPARLDAWGVIGIAAAGTLLSAWFELPAVLPEAALARVLGLVGWVGLAIALLALMRTAPAWRAAAAAAALALVAHAQIEMTPVWPNAAALFMAFVGVAAAPLAPAPAGSDRLRSFAAAAAPAALAAVVLVVGVLPAARWERRLADAAAHLRPVAEFRERLHALRDGPRPAFPGDSPQRLHADIAALLGAPTGPTTPATVERDLARLLVRRAAAAERDLREGAAGAFPAHAPTLSAAGRLALETAVTHADLGDPAASAEWAERAERLADLATESPVGRAGAFAWLATVRAARADLSGETAHLERAVEAWEAAAALDPHGATFAKALMEANLGLGRPAEAARWAARLIEIDDRLRLDPLVRLTPEERSRAERLAAGN